MIRRFGQVDRSFGRTVSAENDRSFGRSFGFGRSLFEVINFLTFFYIQNRLPKNSERPKPKLRPKLRPFSAESVRPKLRWRVPNHRIGEKPSFLANFGRFLESFTLFFYNFIFCFFSIQFYHSKCCKLLQKVH